MDHLFSQAVIYHRLHKFSGKQCVKPLLSKQGLAQNSDHLTNPNFFFRTRDEIFVTIISARQYRKQNRSNRPTRFRCNSKRMPPDNFTVSWRGGAEEWLNIPRIFLPPVTYPRKYIPPKAWVKTFQLPMWVSKSRAVLVSYRTIIISLLITVKALREKLSCENRNARRREQTSPEICCRGQDHSCPSC